MSVAFGKSYGAKKYVTNHFIKKNKQFVYIRRFKTELEEALFKDKMPIWFDQIKKEFPGVKLTNNKEVFKIDDKIAGYAIPLSTSNILKSATFENVDTIIFDEFLLARTGSGYHYLQNEIIQFAELLETIMRMRPNIKVFMLGNAISVSNPYFDFFNLSLPYNSEFKVFRNGLIVVNYIKNLEYRKAKKETIIGKLFEGTEYGRYAIDNEFLEDNKDFIHKKTATSKFAFTINVNNNKYGVWIDYTNKYMFISNDYDPNFKLVFSFNKEDHNEDTILLRLNNSSFLKSILEYYRLSRLFYEGQSIKNNFTSAIISKLQR